MKERVVLTSSLCKQYQIGDLTIGVSVGLFVTFAFLIPEPVISQNTLVSVAGWLLLALSLLWLSSLYPAMKAIKKSVVSAIYSV